jgi:Icc-related predicted phosphoesterase
MARIVLASDTHMLHDKVDWPEGDILIHAGDMTSYGTSKELDSFVDWAEHKAPYSKVVMVAGNHDRAFTKDNQKARKIVSKSGKITYLEDSSCEIENGGELIRFYGSPWTFNNLYKDNEWAFGKRSEPDLSNKWKMMPSDIDILVTHSPPKNVLDKTYSEENVGSLGLLGEVMGRIKPKVHVFGHVHEAYGTVQMDGITFVNASLCSVNNMLENEPVIIEA